MIKIDAITTDTSTADRTTATVSHTVVDETNMGLIVFVGHNDVDDIAVSTVTYDGQSMTSNGAVAAGGTLGFLRMTSFALPAPSVGANDVVVTWAAAVIASVVIIISYSGLIQAGFIGDTDSTSGFSAAPSATVTTTQPNSVVIGGYVIESGASDPAAPGNDITERWDIATGTNVSDDVASAGGDRLQAAVGDVTIDFTANATDTWTIAVLELKEQPLVMLTAKSRDTRLVARKK